MSQPLAPKIVRCPTCRGDSVFAASNPHRPFCSLRCHRIDLGAWASESFSITEPADPSDPAHPIPAAEPVADPDAATPRRARTTP